MNRKILLLAMIMLLCINTNSQWKQLNGPERANIAGLASIDSMIFAVTNHHLYSSSNKGTTWTRRGFSEYFLLIEGVSINSITAKGKILLINFFGKELFRSTNNGKDWTLLIGTKLLQSVEEFVWDGDTMYAASNIGVFKSTDLGSSWKKLNGNLPFTSSPTAGTVVRSITLSDSNIYIGVDNRGIYRSVKGDTNWTSVNTGIEKRSVRSILSIDSMMYAGTDSGLFRLNNNQWKSVDTSFDKLQINDIKYFDKIYIVTNLGVITSDKNITHWSWSKKNLKDYTGYFQYNIHNNINFHDNSVFVGTSVYGIFRSDDSGKTWIGTGSTARKNYIPQFIVRDTIIFASTYDDIYLSNDEGNNWTNLVTDSVFSVRYIAFSDSTLYASTSFNMVFRKEGMLSPWELIFSGTSVDQIIARQDSIYLVTEEGIFFSPNKGTSIWLLDTTTIGKKINSLNTFGETYLTTTSKGVFISNDHGMFWKKTNLPIFTIYDKFAFEKVQKHFIAWDGYSMFRMKEADTIWNEIVIPSNLGFAEPPFMVVKDSIIFISTLSGAFYSKDIGKTWIDMHFYADWDYDSNKGLTTCIGLNNNKVFASSAADGIWYRNLNEIFTTIIENIKTHPESYFLSQNYPNPFNPSTTINFEIPTQSFVKIKIYDLLGREIVTLVNELKNEGTHTIQWNASQFASGVYFVKMNAGSFVSTKKLILAK